ncbi:chlorophyll synthesis pathway protein BchC [Aquibium sp. A9E412]|uniref:chlorophyll synthesis pathway protein BchC n=1 Tax=Aquibium sp. A9E412 TaxID=2976767 RepID=UPI0025B1C511|nr:chlorophyll synthesis pathway protein BchC [Aquibium sp. A9E412]MDN2566042.1 chlorophyll synthesis pathway protein BchC [Aquibium sp. A9E412]
MNTTAVVLDKPRSIGLEGLTLLDAGERDVVIDVAWSGISTGTEKLLFEGAMPPFPGMGYPLVPGYEAVGRIAQAGAQSGRRAGDMVFVPGARCFRGVNGLFGATASRLVVAGERAVVVPEPLGEDAVLLALAATAHHALRLDGAPPPDLVIGHGVLGRLLARVALALGFAAPTVWERDAARRDGARGYRVIDGAADTRSDYRAIIDASGDPHVLDTAIAHLAPRGHITLAGFYGAPLGFAFPPAFMREARIAIAAEFTPDDTRAVLALAADGRLRLDGLITHRAAAADAPAAYATAFGDPACVKMVLDWRTSA